MADTPSLPGTVSLAADAQGMAQARDVAARAQGGRNGMAVRGGKPMDEAAIDKTAQDFEAVFLGQMLQHMWEGVKVDPYTGGGHAEETFRGIMIEEQAKAIAKGGGIGLAAAVKAQIIRMQNAADGGPSGPSPAIGAGSYQTAQRVGDEQAPPTAALAQADPSQPDALPHDHRATDDQT